MAPQRPEDWPHEFEQHLNAGELESVMDVYEPEARFVSSSRETLAGRDRIRGPLAGMIRAKTRLASRVVRAITVGDVAMLYTDFRGTRLDDSAKPVEVLQRAIEVLRRQ